VAHERVWASSFIQGVCGVTSEDIFYINLPLYHSAGFLIGLIGCIERGVMDYVICHCIDLEMRGSQMNVFSR